MEVRSFNKIWIRYQECIEAYKKFMGPRKGKDFGISHSRLTQQRKNQLYHAVKYYEKKMLKFGEGSVIEVSGTRYKYDKVDQTFHEEPFKMVFTGITIEDAKDYINTLVKLKIIEVDLSTIHYYIIKTGIHLLTKPVIDYV